jgi:hypothetical protein
MQDQLFDRSDLDADGHLQSADHDPYDDVKRAGERLAAEFQIDVELATDMVLSFGSEAAARRAAVQRFLLGEERSKAA